MKLTDIDNIIDSLVSDTIEAAYKWANYETPEDVAFYDVRVPETTQAIKALMEQQVVEGRIKENELWLEALDPSGYDVVTQTGLERRTQELKTLATKDRAVTGRGDE